MNKISSLSDIKNLKTIMSVWAHPDDESYTCGGIMTAAIKNGQKVICLTATKGEKGIQDESRWPADRLAEIRAAEMQKVLDIIGITDHCWLGYKDGECHKADEKEAADKIASAIDQYKVDTILTFGPDGMTGHEDHKTVSAWVDLAVKISVNKPAVYHAVMLKTSYDRIIDLDDKFNIFFNIDKPPLVEENSCDICLQLRGDALDTKYRCLCAMPSQTDAMFSTFGRERVCDLIEYETFVKV